MIFFRRHVVTTLTISFTILTLANPSSADPTLTDSKDVNITSFAQLVVQGEVSVFVDPNDANRVLMTSNRWTASSWMMGAVTPADIAVMSCVSSDGGKTWDCDEAGTGANTFGDPACVISASGSYYNVFIRLVPETIIGCAKSTSSGQPGSWIPTEDVAPGTNDKPHLWIDNANPAPRLFAAWSSEDDLAMPRVIRTAFAIDANPVDWTGHQTISDASGRGGNAEDRGVNVQVGPGSEVYAVWRTGPTGGQGRNLGFARSLNDGLTWPLKKYISEVTRQDGTTVPLLFREIQSLGGAKVMPVKSFPSMTVDQTTGRVLAVWANDEHPVSGQPGIDVYVIRSDDRGDSWSEPIRVNQVATGDQWFPWIAWDGATGALAVIFYDSRNYAANDSADVYVAVSRDGGLSWEDFQVSDTSGSDSFSADARGTGLDYIGIATGDGCAYPVWVDDRNKDASQESPPFPRTSPSWYLKYAVKTGGIWSTETVREVIAVAVAPAGLIQETSARLKPQPIKDIAFPTSRR